MTEVIAFLIEHFQDFDTCPPPDDLGRILEDAGFDTAEIGNTLMMMEVLLNSSEFSADPVYAGSLRIFSPEESEMLPTEVVGLLHYLQTADAVTPAQREVVIHALMHIPPEEISVDTAKVLTLLVLWAHKSELPVLIGDDLMAALHGEAVMH